MCLLSHVSGVRGGTRGRRRRRDEGEVEEEEQHAVRGEEKSQGVRENYEGGGEGRHTKVEEDERKQNIKKEGESKEDEDEDGRKMWLVGDKKEGRKRRFITIGKN